MPPGQHSAKKKTDADFVRAVRLLQKNGRFADAFHLGRAQLENCSQFEGMLAGLIRNAHEAGLLDECLDFLIALAARHPDDAELPNYIAGLLGETGQRRQSRAFAKTAAARRPFFASRAGNAKMRVLALQCIATADYRYSPISGRFFLPGITNLYALLDPDIAVHRLLVDDLPAALAAVNDLPKCDIVLNAISDPDYEEALRNARTLGDALELPVFNPPDRVRAMNRASLPGILHEKSDRIMAARAVYLPPEKTESSDILSAMRDNDCKFPVIVRAPGFQGGRHMALAESDGDIDGLGEELYRDNGVYIIEFVDVSFRDGRAPGRFLYPKYRAFFSNGRLFPIHLFVSEQYEVHKKTAIPVHARHSWLADMETDFLRDPAGHLPEGMWSELGRVMSSFHLDYAGVDFAISARGEDSGKLVLFECNAAMANRLANLPEGGLIQRQWRDVTLAAHDALCMKSGVAAWPFILKKGLLVC